ncbi:MAG: YfcE family phosphodiesterase [Candidatus Woesearchaeota archaeon]|jgi:hypothetical protein|nr:YfcE family phosphodiesterase [Candidatus Woesearchaeota archaeon]MDP7506434.1 YfcE family phosphodiesterase [Candidatus Woesearchaeota archaeon]MDP7610762.1 YfcE family phosphodiesterase [Candidatus Woesearchaeota archaeon]|tara:strand:+ start:93 stop:584 length:492 start_codon:yes stop_codon:yes gene_type:complete
MIGLISDTHDNVPNIIKAVEIFKEKGVEFVLHLGDVVAPSSIRFFKGLDMRFIKGNCDGDVETLKKKIDEINGKFYNVLKKLKHKDKVFMLFHGKPEEELDEMINRQAYDYVIHGHTHSKRDDKFENTRVINPGAHYTAPDQKEHTIAILDVEKDKLEFIEIT